MWKVMIADDEPKIRRGLKTAIERIRPDMKVVAEAEDGETALALVRSEQPDILVVDVRMPFLNGLDLIERISDQSGDCIVIVVSGHDEFQYAQRALQLKVFEYLLKPVPEELLAGVLGRAEEALSTARRQKQYLAWARDQLDRNLPLLRELFLRDWVGGRLSRVEIAEQAQFLGVRVAGPMTIALIHIVDRFAAAAAAAPDERERRLALFAIRSVVEETLASLGPLVVFSDDRDDIVVLCAPAGGTLWADAPAAIEQRVVPALCQAIIVVQASVPEALHGVPEAYESLCAEVARRGSHQALVVHAQGYIDAHFDDPGLSLEEVSSSARISPGYLSRLLKLETGFSFVEYLTRVRVNKALQMMNDPAVKVYEVAEAVGYQSQHYFSRAFKRVFGRPPVEYRKAGS
jgi:two-component system, response regulator YesN